MSINPIFNSFMHTFFIHRNIYFFRCNNSYLFCAKMKILGNGSLKRKPHKNIMYVFVYDGFRIVSFEIYRVLVSGFISLALYFMKEAIDISFRGTFRNLQNFTKTKASFLRRHYTRLFMINNYGFRPHACYQNESSTKAWHFKQKLFRNFFCSSTLFFNVNFRRK